MNQFDPGDKVKITFGVRSGTIGKIIHKLHTDPVTEPYKVKLDDSAVGYEYGFYYDDEMELVS